MNQTMQCFTCLGTTGGEIRSGVIGLPSVEWETNACPCNDQERRGRRALKNIDYLEHVHQSKLKCGKHHYGNGFSSEDLVGKPANNPNVPRFLGHKPTVCRIFDMDEATPNGSTNCEDHLGDGETSVVYEANNGFLGGWLKQLQSATAGVFGFWSMLPVKEEFLDLSREPAGTSFVWEGWGTSLCWWANFVGGLPETEADFVLDLIFDPQRGLGLNIARYNIGGGADVSVDTNLRPFADIPGFQLSADGAYDWSADERQRKVLLGAKARGVNKFEAFSNSPPQWMTISGSVTGNWGRGQDNLDPEHYDAFADYLTEVVRQYENEWGVHFDYLAPFNEPVEGFWNIDRKKPAQEGCNFSTTAIKKIIHKVKESLVQKGLSTEISAVDSWSLNTARVIRALDEETIRQVSQINVHTYIPFVQREGDARRNEVQRTVSGLQKKLWVSEYGPLHWRGSELDIALAVARHINLDINELHPSAWCYWQVLEVPGKNFYWGLLHAEFDYNLTSCVELKKQYYIMMQYSRWIRPGFLIYPVGGNCKSSLVIALDSSSHATLVMIFTNTSDRNREISFDTSSIADGLKDGPIQAALFRTSETENHEQLPIMHFESPILAVRIDAKSITTIVVSK